LLAERAATGRLPLALGCSRPHAIFGARIGTPDPPSTYAIRAALSPVSGH